MTDNAVLDAILGELRDLRAIVASLALSAVPGDPAVTSRGLVDAAELARALGVRRDYVYRHRVELGGVPLSDGLKPRLRFDVETARAAMTRFGSERSQSENVNDGGQVQSWPRRGGRRLPVGQPKPGSILQSRPRGDARHAA